MELELHVAPLKKKSKLSFGSFKKIKIKNLDVDNYEVYWYTQIQSKTHCILAQQNEKFAKISNFQTMHRSRLDLDLCVCYFRWAIKYYKFGLIFYTLVHIIIFYTKIFCPNLFETSKNELDGARALPLWSPFLLLWKQNYQYTTVHSTRFGSCIYNFRSCENKSVLPTTRLLHSKTSYVLPPTHITLR
jgi:hypothetical protein